jgi:hypothetical protein
MLKMMLFVGAAAVSFPAFAQENPPAGSDPAQPTAPSGPAQPGADPLVGQAPPPAEPAPSSQPTPPVGTAQPAQPAQPAQIAQIVEQEFPTYDADGNADLNDAEFGAWMKKLRVATDPSVDPESQDVRTWIGQAYAAADADKSGGVSKAELIAFLSRGS